jgi:hypothetical protein
MVATSFDHAKEEPPEVDRIASVFDTEGGNFRPERARILTNSNPDKDMETYENRARDQIESLISDKGGVPEKSIDTNQIPFYDSREAFYKAYDIIYEEKVVKDNIILINFSGGTKPLTIGLSQAAAMLDVQLDPVWIGKRYKMVDGELKATDYNDEKDTFNVNMLDIEDPVPNNGKKRELLSLFYEYCNDSIRITPLLEKGDVIPSIDEVSGEEKTLREEKRDEYYEIRDELKNSNLLTEANKSNWSLTEEGEHVARLASIRYSHDNESESNE